MYVTARPHKHAFMLRGFHAEGLVMGKPDVLLKSYNKSENDERSSTSSSTAGGFLVKFVHPPSFLRYKVPTVSRRLIKCMMHLCTMY